MKSALVIRRRWINRPGARRPSLAIRVPVGLSCHAFITGERPCNFCTRCFGWATCSAPSTSTPIRSAWTCCAPPTARTRSTPSPSSGFGGGNRNGEAELELTYNYGESEYDLGTAYGHVALGVDSVAETCERIRAAGGNVTREPGPVKGWDHGDRVRGGSGRLQGRADRDELARALTARAGRGAALGAARASEAIGPRPRGPRAMFPGSVRSCARDGRSARTGRSARVGRCAGPAIPASGPEPATAPPDHGGFACGSV